LLQDIFLTFAAIAVCDTRSPAESVIIVSDDSLDDDVDTSSIQQQVCAVLRIAIACYFPSYKNTTVAGHACSLYESSKCMMHCVNVSDLHRPLTAEETTLCSGERASHSVACRSAKPGQHVLHCGDVAAAEVVISCARTCSETQTWSS